MRDFKGIKRQRNRNRNVGGKPQGNANRAFDSNGPEGVKVRGAAQHVYEKYQQLARDAQMSGDRVLAENYLQHAEHYFRVLRAMQPQRSVAEIIGRDQIASGYDIDFEDESGQAEAAEGEAEGGEAEAEGRAEARAEGRAEGQERNWREGRQEWRGERSFRGSRDDRFRDDRQRDDRPREDRYRDDRPRDDRPRDDRFRDERPRDERPRDERPRDERPRDERPREDRPREDRFRDDRPRRYERSDRGERAWRAEAPEGRPAETEADQGPVLRADDGEVSHAPAFLQPRAPAPERSDAPPAETRRPRRRRAPRDLADAGPVAEAEDA